MAKKPDSSVPEPTLAERARTLMSVGGSSSLSTMSVKHPGYPFGSVMPYAVDESGNPIVLISQMAMHTKNLRAEPRATLLVAQQSGSSLGTARISVIGDVAKVEESDTERIAAIYFEAHPESRQWASFGDFDFYKMTVKDVYHIGGFGVMGWVTAEDYAAAEADPLVESARDIIDHMNEDHVESMILLIQKQLGIKTADARMTAVDRYGFNVLMKVESKTRGGRIGFSSIANSPTEVRKILVAMVNEARG